jgi:adenine/guanine phosphoribosyltransferase-like PRPP-binding protein
MLIEISSLTNETPDGPLVGSGTISVGYNEYELDVQVSVLPVHPATTRELEKFKGKHVTVSISEITLEALQSYKESERDDMRYTEQYAVVCRKLGYEIRKYMKDNNVKVDYALAVDHAGQLITMFVAKISDIESYEIRRIKKFNDDGTIKLTVLLPQNIYPIDGKKFLLLDEFINTGFTLKEVIDTIHRGGGEVVMIGAFKNLEGQGEMLKEKYSDIPVVTLE